MAEPIIIQGGMGIGVSNWTLARAVSSLGQLGVVSGTALDSVFIRRLQSGDPGGAIRRALAQFPFQDIAQKILETYFIPNGKSEDAGFAVPPMWTIAPTAFRQSLAVAANFAEVFLAKEGHGGKIGINFLEKVQLPTLPSLYGALLAGVDYVLVGAGIPREIPGVLDQLARHKDVSLQVHVEGAAPDDDFRTRFSPKQIVPGKRSELLRPRFLPIIASATLAIALAKKATGRIDGFVIEGPTAGGHNAPPRGHLQLSAKGEPVYGARDEVDLNKIKQLGLPFWLAGSHGDPQRLEQALEVGAAGVQVGTAFAFCQESGMADDIKSRVLELARKGEVVVFADPKASPTGFPFKVVQVDGTLSDPKTYAMRPKQCDLGYLRQVYKKEDGTLGYRCSAETVESYLKKDGMIEETRGRKCLCNGLMTAIDFPQRQRSGFRELPLVTAGDDVKNITQFLKPGKASYTAADVIQYLLSRRPGKTT